MTWFGRALGLGPGRTAASLSISSGRERRERVATAQKDEACGPLDAPAHIPKRWYNAAVPYLWMIVSSFLGMWLSGRGALAAMSEAQRKTAGVSQVREACILLCLSISI